MHCTVFGTTKAGSTVHAYTLLNHTGMSVCVLDYGCTIQSMTVPAADGRLINVVLGFDNLASYEAHDAFFGATIGRFANRIGKGAFVLNGVRYPLAINNGPNHLHGGLCGFDKRIFLCEDTGEENALAFRYRAADGEEGYPGNLDVTVMFRLAQTANCLEITYFARSDADTFVNLTNHSYFNLNGAGSGTVLDHTLQLYAAQYTEIDADGLPTGVVADVAGTPFDFRIPKRIGRDIEASHPQIVNGHGYDHNFVLDPAVLYKNVCKMTADKTGLSMSAQTTMPGVQVYTANFLGAEQGMGGVYHRRDGVCFETQYFPDCMAHPQFPSALLRAGETYTHKTQFCFAAQ